MRKCSGRACVADCASGVIAGPSHGGRDFDEQERRHDYRVASFLNRSKDLKALGISWFVAIEGIHEDASVYSVPETSRQSPWARTPTSTGGHLYRRIADNRRTPLTAGRKRRSSRRPACMNLSQAWEPSESSIACKRSSIGSTGRITPTARPRCVRMYDARESLTWRKMRAALAFNSRTPTSFWMGPPRLKAFKWSLM